MLPLDLPSRAVPDAASDDSSASYIAESLRGASGRLL